MKRRLYFLLPDVNSTKIIHNELLLARIEERNMHVLARDDISLAGLPEASLLEKSDLIHGLQLGFIVGGFTGTVLAISTYLFGMIVPGWETIRTGNDGLFVRYDRTWLGNHLTEWDYRWWRIFWLMDIKYGCN